MRGISIAGLALFGCQPPTQLRVELEGACAEVGVLARTQLNDPSDVDSVSTTGPCVEGAPLDIVLVPDTGSDAVEILVIASLTEATSVEACRASYQARLDGGSTEGPPDCVFARRSVGFAEGESRALVILLEPACGGDLRCDLTETCVDGPDGTACVRANTVCDEDGVCDLEDEA